MCTKPFAVSSRKLEDEYYVISYPLLDTFDVFK